MKPLVTVVIPTCNRSAYLRETLQSVREQDYENLEILVSDNASTDDTAAVVSEIAASDPRVRYRRNLVKIPLIPHFNQCVAQARGEFFVLLSDDDRVNETFVSSLAEIFSQNPLVHAAIPANAIIDENGAIVRQLPAPQTEIREGIDFVIDWLWRRREIPVANFVTLMARTETVRQLRYQPFPGGLNSDNLLFLQLALSGQIAISSTARFYWRVHERQQGHRISPRNVRRAGRDFQKFVHRNPALRKLIDSHRPHQQRLVRRGIQRVTAEAYLQSIGFFDKPYRVSTLLSLLSHPPDSLYLRLVFREYRNLLRRRLFAGFLASADSRP